MGAALSNWMAKGYQGLPSRSRSHTDFMSWRFWSGVAGKDTFHCGIMRDSSDSIGRPYPMLMLGAGPLDNWETQWQLSPYACERTWNQMEAISTRTFHDLRHLEEEIRRIKPPEPNWSDLLRLENEMVKLGGSCIPSEIKVLQEQAKTVAKKSEIFIPIDESLIHDHLRLILLWLFNLKSLMADIPKAVFMGGNQLRTFLVIFRRPLSTQDFLRIWYVCSNQGQEVRSQGAWQA